MVRTEKVFQSTQFRSFQEAVEIFQQEYPADQPLEGGDLESARALLRNALYLEFFSLFNQHKGQKFFVRVTANGAIPFDRCYVGTIAGVDDVHFIKAYEHKGRIRKYPVEVRDMFCKEGASGLFQPDKDIFYLEQGRRPSAGFHHPGNWMLGDIIAAFLPEDVARRLFPKKFQDGFFQTSFVFAIGNDAYAGARQAFVDDCGPDVKFPNGF